MTTRIRTICGALALLISANACRPQAKPPEVQTPTLDVTDWTEKTELFMEYPPLVACQMHGALCRASDADGRLQARHRRAGQGGVHARSRRPIDCTDRP